MATLIGTMILAIGLPAWAGITYVGLVRARRGDELPQPRPPRRPRSPARKAAWGAGLAYLAGGALHLYGLSYMPFLFPEDACWFGVGIKAYPDSSSALPVSLVCRGIEVVPWWVNPGLLVLAVTAVAATVASVVLAVRGSRRAAAVRRGA
ncbi:MULTISPECIES: hypothetical protein [Streptomyces]|uniref:Uncharacterized protein n=1 Tax=Streptomyces venezuelae (strain ATCC 10712 / CBS 650.69 / DSM 40230 / JCM 4526 / NBRC 13096 / PD 04745) TaxID=953739 RepID=F2RKR9_STRVP|nr:hypothetical protein [Streptomyces venezuelae]APE21299.1 hypothetical protein vnz_09890 [Streptomyces venezuelae]QER98691.1 hypothetical protein DEJ43_09995 [Streptomyces venezuelae ATCC 10712]CCA55308.1 hypothetical protein SVEN_2021 [Streptomyces venezuelae ATCC 10712]